MQHTQLDQILDKKLKGNIIGAPGKMCMSSVSGSGCNISVLIS